MKTKALMMMLVVALTLSASTSGLKVRRADSKATKQVSEDKTDTQTDISAATKDQDKETNDKEVHKRGIFYNGLGGLSSHSALSAYLPRTYASHYGYNLRLPGSTTFSSSALAAAPSVTYAHAHAPTSFLKYPVSPHFKASFGALPAVTAYHSAGVLPHAHFSHAVPPVTSFAAAAPAAWPHTSVAGPAYVESPTYAAAPAVFSGASVAPAPIPAVPALPALPAVPASVPAAPIVPAAPAAVFPAPAVASAPVPAPAPVPFVLRSGGAVVSSYNVNYPHHYYQKPAVSVQPVAPVPAVAPTFVQPQAAAPAIPATPNLPAFPVQPAFPAFSTIPAVPSFPAIPSLPAVPIAPIVPSQPPARPFVPTQPVPVNPLPGPPSPPDSGSALASPQIPPPVTPQPESPQPTQASWKPIVDRPSITLMPPYGAPGEAYLPPAAPSQQLQQQQLSGSLFDNLTDAEIQHIFSQAAQAQQQHQQHYHSQHRNSAYRHHY